MSHPAHLSSLVLPCPPVRQGAGRKVGGFSMIEVMMTMVLILLIIMVGMPTFSGILASMRVRSVAEGMLSGIQMARTEAVRRNQPVSFQLDSETGGGWSVVLTADGSALQTKPASEGGAIIVQGDLDTTLTFNNLGQRTAPAGGVLTFTFANPDVDGCQPSGSIRCLSITVQAGGQARLCDPARTSPDPQAC